MAKTVVVKDQFGDLYDMPAENLQQAMQSGYSQATPEDLAFEAKREKFGGTAGELKAAGAGALSSATFGLGTKALTSTGIVDPETIKGLREVNPVAYATGEVGGVIGSAFLPGVNLVKGAEIARKGITAGVAKMLPEATTLGGKVLQSATAGAVGSAAEGAFYGAGALINDSALGDPDLNAEKVMSTLGYSAAFGGGIGAILGPVERAFAGRAKGFLSESVDGRPITPKDTLDMAIGSQELVTPQQRVGIVDGLKQLKTNAKEIKSAAEEIGAPLLESQISASKYVQDLDSLLSQSRTPIGIARQQLFKQGADAAETAVKQAVGDAPMMTAVEVGDAIKASLTAKVESKVKPISEMYDYLKQSTEFIPVSDKAKQVIAANLRSETQQFSIGIEKKIGDAILNNLENLKTVDDLKRFNTQLYKEFPMNKSDVARYAEKITNLEEASVIRAAEKFAAESGDQEAKALITGLIGTRKEANASYKALMEEIGELSGVLGKKRVKGPGDFIDFVDDLTSEKIVDKLFTKKNSAFLEKFAKTFPEEASLIFANERGKMLTKAIRGESFSVAALAKQVDDLSPEVRNVMFTPEQLKKIKAAKTYLDAIPKNINPSGSATTIELQKYMGDVFTAGRDIAAGLGAGAAMGGPVGAVIGGIAGAIGTQKNLVRDYGIEKIISAAVRGGAENSPELLMQKLSTVERTINKTTNAIERLSKSVVEVTGKTVDALPGAVIILNQEEREKKFQKVKESIEETNSPDAYVDKMDRSTASLYPAAPAITGSMQMAMTRATEFLRSKLPAPGPIAPLSPELKPSNAEITKFFKYYEIVENPLNILRQVKSGMLSTESMETMKTVYPALLQEMRTAVMDKITDKKAKDIPYQTKIMLSFFLEQDLVYGVSSSSILANQVSFAGPSHKQDDIQTAVAQKNPSQKGLESLTLSKRSQTGTESVITRKS